MSDMLGSEVVWLGTTCESTSSTSTVSHSLVTALQYAPHGLEADEDTSSGLKSNSGLHMVDKLLSCS